MSQLTPCPLHPGMLLLPDLTCPICAQEKRAAAYERQRVEMAQQVAKPPEDKP